MQYIIRQTHAKNALACPRRFKVEVIEGRTSPTSEEAALGTLVHDVIFRYVNRCVALGIPNDSAVIPNLVESEYGNALRHPLQRSGLKRAVELVNNFVEMFDVPPTVEMTEEPFSFTIGEFTFTGRPDCILKVGNCVRTLDWKSGRAEYDNDFQTRFYSLLQWRTFPELEEFEGQTLFLAGKTMYPAIPESYTRQDLERFEAELVRYFTAIVKDGTFPPSPNKFCGWCPGLSDCPLPDAYLEPRSKEQAEEIARGYLLTTAKAEAQKKQLKPWVVRNGDIEVAGASIGYHGGTQFTIKRGKGDSSVQGTSDTEPSVDQGLDTDF